MHLIIIIIIIIIGQPIILMPSPNNVKFVTFLHELKDIKV